nr:peptidoglycan recognition protein 2 [Sepioteuthis lessoniana]
MALISLRVMIFQIVWFMTVTGAPIEESCACNKFPVVTRAEWGASPPKEIVSIPMPVDIVFIHHTAMDYCYNISSCSAEMRKIQDFHMIDRGWFDIGYNYLVGEDGRVYEGRGWDREGAHTKGYNRVAVAISVMGDFTSRIPNQKALSAVQNLILCGVEQNKISENYSLFGHRDVRNTACPGDSFYRLIHSWKGFHKPNNKVIIG